MSRELTWTTAQPTGPGFYWWRHLPRERARVVEVAEITADRFLGALIDPGVIIRLSDMAGAGEWAGPLPITRPAEPPQPYRPLSTPGSRASAAAP